MRESKKEQIIRILINSNIALEPKDLAEKVHINDLNKFLSIIRELQGEGKLIITKRGKIISSKSSGLTPAKIISQSKLFAFARPLDNNEDIFILAEDMKTAILGDIVLLHRIKQSDKGPRGEVERIVSKGSRTITGTIERWHNGCELVPDVAFRYNIPILRGATLGARDGDKVKVVLSSSPRRKQLSARVVKIYGKSESAKVCSDAIIDENDIPSVFPQAVILEAKKVASKQITSKDIDSRLDLRDKLIFTIDSEDAKDLDDAISIEKKDDSWFLGVHIADVSHYIKKGSLIDSEAQLRGTSVYFADRVIPMLPKEISNGVCSLNAHEDKLTFSALLEIDSKGNLKNFEFVKTIINSKVRGVYSEINKILSNTADNSLLEKYSCVLPSIFEAAKLAKLLEEKSNQRGNMDLQSSESRFKLDENGVCIDVSPRVQGESEKLIEQFMIMANQAAASYAKSVEIPFVYRVHESPNPQKIDELKKLANALGLNTSRINVNSKSSDFSKLLENSKNTTFSKIISHQVLRTMSKAKYSPNPLGHFGLSLQDYCHFTSPIRRYPDTTIHRILSDLISGVPINTIEKIYGEFTCEVSKSCSDYEVRAMRAERDAEKCYMAEYMAQHIGEIFNGIISGISSRGIFVELENSVEGFISLDLYENRKFILSNPVTLTDEVTNDNFSIGDNIKVKVLSAKIANGLIDFAPCEE